MPYADDYLYDPNKDEEKNNPEGPQLAGASQVLGGSSQQQPAQAAGAKGPTSSDRFQNLNSYLTANQGNQFGEQFAGRVNEDVNKGAQAQQQAVGGFRNLADAGSTAQNSQLVDSAVSDPTKFVQDQGNVAAFKGQLNAQYGGPNSFADAGDVYQKASGATQKATNTAGEAQTEGGRFALLDNYFGKPEYNQGQKSLDNLLISGNQNAQQGLAQAQANAQAQQKSFRDENTQLSNYAAQKRGETEAINKYARTALGVDSAGNLLAPKPSSLPVPTAPQADFAKQPTPPTPLIGADGKPAVATPQSAAPKTNVLADFNAQLGTNAGEAKSKYEGEINAIQDALKRGDLTGLSAESRSLLGLDGQSGSLNTFGIDPTSNNYLHINAQPSQFNKNTVTSTQDAAKLQALAQLAGIDPGTLLDYSQAGTAPKRTGLASFDNKEFHGAVTNAQQQAITNELGRSGTSIPPAQLPHPDLLSGSSLSQPWVGNRDYRGSTNIISQLKMATQAFNDVNEYNKKGGGFGPQVAAAKANLDAIQKSYDQQTQGLLKNKGTNFKY